MLTIFRHIPVSTLFVDVSLCFLAILLAAASMPELAGVAMLHTSSPVLLPRAGAFALITVFMFACLGLYRPVRLGLPAAFWRTIAASLLGGYIAYPIFEAATGASYAGRLVPLAVEYLTVGLLVGKLTGAWLRKSVRTPRVLIVGTGPDALAVAQDLRESKAMRREVIGFCTTCHEPGAHVDATGTPVFPESSSIVELVSAYGIEEIVVAVRDQRGGNVPMDQLLACRIRGIPVLDLAGCYERTRAEVSLDSLKASWLVYGQGFSQSRGRKFVKRVMDVVGSSLLLLLCSPVMLLTMLAIRLDSPGPAFYRQERVGFGGKVFMCMKFRSMRTDAERDGVARWASKNDSRVTRVGTFIRRTRIDELPQLFTVLKGEMSLVGPRPERPSFVAELRKHIPFYDLRHSIKPGLTGWAQVRNGYGASVDEARRKHQFDLFYVKNNSIVLDLLVLVETVSVVLFREGQ
jgi:sugar transferase (PEP-CTERM system associated)